MSLIFHVCHDAPRNDLGVFVERDAVVYEDAVAVHDARAYSFVVRQTTLPLTLFLGWQSCDFVHHAMVGRVVDGDKCIHLWYCVFSTKKKMNEVFALTGYVFVLVWCYCRILDHAGAWSEERRRSVYLAGLEVV